MSELTNPTYSKAFNAFFAKLASEQMASEIPKEITNTLRCQAFAEGYDFYKQLTDDFFHHVANNSLTLISHADIKDHFDKYLQTLK